jgi:hypothetical protein
VYKRNRNGLAFGSTLYKRYVLGDTILPVTDDPDDIVAEGNVNVCLAFTPAKFVTVVSSIKNRVNEILSSPVNGKEDPVSMV